MYKYTQTPIYKKMPKISGHSLSSSSSITSTHCRTKALPCSAPFCVCYCTSSCRQMILSRLYTWFLGQISPPTHQFCTRYDLPKIFFSLIVTRLSSIFVCSVIHDACLLPLWFYNQHFSLHSSFCASQILL